MKRTRFSFLGLVFASVSSVFVLLPASGVESEPVKATTVQEKVLRHAVFFSFKDGTTEADTEKVVTAFSQLPEKIDTITDYQFGLNVAPKERSGGLTHCFLLSFADEAGRAVYLPHPEHKAFGDVLGPFVKDVFVIDYWGKKVEQPAAPTATSKMAVFVKFKPDTDAEQIKSVQESLSEKLTKLDAVDDLEWGVNNSPEAHGKGFTHVWMMTMSHAGTDDQVSIDPMQKEIADTLNSLAENIRILVF